MRCFFCKMNIPDDADTCGHCAAEYTTVENWNNVFSIISFINVACFFIIGWSDSLSFKDFFKWDYPLWIYLFLNFISIFSVSQKVGTKRRYDGTFDTKYE